MLEPIFERFNLIHPLSTEVKERFEQAFKIITCSKGEHLLREGDVCNHMYYILKGIVRVYYNKDGLEITSRLMSEGYFITSFISYFTRKPGIEFLECYEHCELAAIHYNDVQKLYKDFPEFNYTARVLTEYSFFLSEQRTVALRRTSVSERIAFFYEQHKDLTGRVASKHIASYLGMTAEVYCRRKRKFFLKK